MAAARKTRKTGGATKRREPFPFRLWLKRTGLFCVFVMAAVLVRSALAGFSKLHWQPLPVEEVTLNHPLVYQTQTGYDDVVADYFGQSLLLIDLDKMRADLEALPWIQKVSLGKRWPGTVVLNVTEYEPVANWNSSEVLNAEGFPLQKPAADLVLADLHGPDNRSKLVMDRYLLFTEIFAARGFSVKGVTLQPRGSWSLELDNRLQILLGEQEVMERSQRVVRLLEKSSLSENNVEYIDARYPNGVAIKIKQNLSSEVEHDVAA